MSVHAINSAKSATFRIAVEVPYAKPRAEAVAEVTGLLDIAPSRWA